MTSYHVEVLYLVSMFVVHMWRQRFLVLYTLGQEEFWCTLWFSQRIVHGQFLAVLLNTCFGVLIHISFTPIVRSKIIIMLD